MPLLTAATRPNFVSIFAQDPVQVGKFVTFLIEGLALPVDDRFRYDLVNSTTHQQNYGITRNPVERTVSDNIIRRPRSVRIEGRLSANPLGGPIASALGTLGSFVRRDLEMVENLHSIARVGEPVVLITPERPYSSMAIANINERYDASTGNGLILGIDLEEVRIVSPLSVSGVLDLDTVLAGAYQTEAIGPVSSDVPAPTGLAAGGLG